MAATDIEKQSVRRDTLDINRARRLARRRGDMDSVIKYTAMGEAAGLPVGRPVHDEELTGMAEGRLAQRMRSTGISPERGGLDGYDSRHSRDSGIGVGGFDFRQRKDRGGMTLESREGDTTDVPLSRGLDRRAAFSKAWNNAPDEATRDELVERAHKLGVPMNMDAARPSLERRRGSRLLPEPVNPGSGEFMGPVDPDAPAGPAALAGEVEDEGEPLLPKPRIGMRDKYHRALETGKDFAASQTPLGLAARYVQDLEWERKKQGFARRERESQERADELESKYQDTIHSQSVPETMEFPKRETAPEETFDPLWGSLAKKRRMLRPMGGGRGLQ